MELKITYDILSQRQAMPLDLKVDFSLQRIRHWYEKYSGNVYVAFSGGKDSTVLLDLVRRNYPYVPAVFINTGMEYPEIISFVRQTRKVEELRPALNFREVLARHGYPVISKVVARAIRAVQSPGCSQRTKDKALYGDKRGSYGKLPLKWRFLCDAPFKISERCCEVMKIRPILKYHAQTGRAGIVATMAADSNSRRKQYLRHGCYLDHLRCPRCTPLAFWRDADIWQYLRENHIRYSPIYDTGVHHTGCMYCLFGLHLEPSPNRFELMSRTHPTQYAYCMDQCGLRQVLDYLSHPAACGPPTDPQSRASLARDMPLLASVSLSPTEP